MPLIKFDKNAAEGFYLLVTHGQVGGYPGNLFAVSEQLLKELEAEFQARGITYQQIDIKTLNGRRQKPRNSL